MKAKREFKRCRTMADVLADPRVDGFFYGGNDGVEGCGKDIWVERKDGFHWADCGCVVEATWKDVCIAMENVERERTDG